MVAPVRLVVVEYAQNYPALLGLTLALQTLEWPTRLGWVALGSGLAGTLIAYTDHLKTGARPRPRRWAEASRNSLAFFLATTGYLLFVGVLPPLGLAAIGFGAGLLAGLLERGSPPGRLRHALVLAGGGALVLGVLPLMSQGAAPLVAALLNVPFTLVVAVLDDHG
jgi:hypothetical protein